MRTRECDPRGEVSELEGKKRNDGSWSWSWTGNVFCFFLPGRPFNTFQREFQIFLESLRSISKYKPEHPQDVAATHSH